MSKISIAIFTTLFLVGSLSSYRLGVYLSQKAIQDELTATQAMLAFNHLQRYDELAECVRNTRYAAALSKLEHSVISERELLADLLNSTKNEWLYEYISKRSKESIESFRSYKSSRGDRWNEPSCK